MAHQQRSAHAHGGGRAAAGAGAAVRGGVVTVPPSAGPAAAGVFLPPPPPFERAGAVEGGQQAGAAAGAAPAQQQHQQAAPAAAPIVAAVANNNNNAVAPEALLDAVSEGRIELVQTLIRQDPELANHRDGFGQTPLMWASYKGRTDMVGCLLDCGAAINECETRRARTALYLACEFDHADVVALLLKRGADQSLSAQRGWTVLSRGFDGWTPLIIAGYNGCPSVLRCLLSHGESDLDGVDEKGATALWWAAVHNRPEAVKVLLEAGADFGLSNDEGKTPCVAAKERGNHECATLLEAAERAYIMTKSRRLSRESDLLAKMALDLVAAAPSYLKNRISLSLPRLHDDEEITPELQLLIAAAEAEANTMELNTGVRGWRQVAAVNGKIGPARGILGQRRNMVPDGARNEEENSKTLPVISNYVSKHMRYDVFVHFREYMA